MTRTSIRLMALAAAIVSSLGFATLPLSVHAQHQAQQSASSAPSGSYIVTLLAPVGNSRVAGAAAFLTGVGGKGSSSPTAGHASGAGTIAGIVVSGLQPGTKAVARVIHGGCSSVSASTGATTSAAYQSPTMLALPSGDAEVITTTMPTTSSVARGSSVVVLGTAGTLAAANSVGGKVGVVGGSSHTKSTTMAPVACGTLHKPGMVVALKPMMGGKAAGFAMITMSTPVLNAASLNSNAAPKTIPGTEVIVYASGLQPQVASPEHIHAGPCSTSATILFPLNDLLADAQGMAIQGTALPITTPLTGFSLHIHHTNFTMNACGNIPSASTSTSSSTSGQ